MLFSSNFFQVVNTAHSYFNRLFDIDCIFLAGDFEYANNQRWTRIIVICQIQLKILYLCCLPEQIIVINLLVIFDHVTCIKKIHGDVVQK